MKKTLLFLTATFCLANGYAQSAAEQQAWMTFMAPGDQQKMLAKDDGKWSEDITMYMDPGNPTKAKSTCVNQMILGGRYQRSIHTGEMMGMPFEGESILGYDNGRKIWFSTWIDNMGTGIMYGEGDYDAAKKAIIIKGKMTDPSTSKTTDYKEVLTTIDADHQKMEMFVVTNGKDVRTMDILFTRTK
jgi:hypothetical protein